MSNNTAISPDTIPHHVNVTDCPSRITNQLVRLHVCNVMCHHEKRCYITYAKRNMYN